MFYRDKHLRYPVKAETPGPVRACMVQQAIGSVAGDIRVYMQPFFQSWGSRGPNSK